MDDEWRRIGVLLIDAKHAKLIPAIADLLEELRQSGFRIDPKLFGAALALTGE